MSSNPEQKARLLAKMKSDWDRRARQHAAGFIASINSATEKEFSDSGERDVYFVFRHLEHLLGLDQVALDVGCGVGRMDAHIAPRIKKLVGIDVSGEMVAGARTRLAHLDNVEFVEGDGCSLEPLADCSFGLVFSHIVFQHMPRELFDRYLGEVYRVLRPDGHFVFQVPEALDGELPEPALDDTFEMRFHRESDVRNRLERAGFRWHGVTRFRVNARELVFDQLHVHAQRPGG